MREILFRGKRIDNGEWIEGSIIKAKGYYSDEPEAVYYIAPFSPSYTDIKKVIPGTVGQYTGLTDKNGKRIFEGDIVRAKRINTDKSYLGDVIWWLGCFAIQETKTQNVPAIDLFYEYEVIGNIHDNPELLKGGD